MYRRTFVPYVFGDAAEQTACVSIACQALLFHVPCLFWRLLNDRSGININNLVEAAETIQNALYPERREKTIKYMIRHLDHYFEYQRSYRAGWCAPLRRYLARGLFCFRVGNRYGNYLVTLYAATKVLYVANVAAQLLLLDLLLGAGYHLYGAQVNSVQYSSAPAVMELTSENCPQ